MVSFSSGISPLTSTVIFFDKSPFGHGGCHFSNVTDLTGQIAQPSSSRYRSSPSTFQQRVHIHLSAEFSFCAHLTRHTGSTPAAKELS